MDANGEASLTTTVRDATLDLLRGLGTTTVFGNPGSTELPFLNNWPNDFRYILGLQEASVVAMADGFARATGRAAFCNLHSAAGVGHALGNVFTAFRNQAPIVITAGQQARALLPMLPFLGATEAAEFPKPYVKWSAEPARAADVPAAIAHAYYVAMQRPCGPTFVSIPIDDWGGVATPVTPRSMSRDVAPDPDRLAALVTDLTRARRPALVIGPEVDDEGAGNLAVTLAERTRAPVWASPFSCRVSFPEEHPLFAGFLAAAPQAVSDALSGYDTIVVLGAPVFTFHVEGKCALFASGIPLHQITTDPEAAAAAPAGNAIVSSLRLALLQLVALLPERTTRELPLPRKRKPTPAAADPIAAEYLMHAIDRARPEDAIVVEEAPSHRPVMQDYLPMRTFGSFYTMASGGLGYSLPASVGVSLASPGRRVICLIGDGSMMYSVQALWTAVQHALPLAVIVINNGGYGAMRAFSQVLKVKSPPGIDLPGLDFVLLAAGMGCAGTRVTKAADLPAALSRAFTARAPMLVEVMVDPAVPRLYDEP
jgi:benzoylformate decarboxylase